MTTRPTDTVTHLIETGRDREAAVLGARRGIGMDVLTQLQQLAPALAGVVGNIRPDQLDRPTPCADYTVHGVLEHMLGGATTFAAAFRGQEPEEPPTGDLLAAFVPGLTDLAAAISAPGALDRTLATPFGEMDGDTFARAVVLDGLVHGWDLATATGQLYDPPAELVAAVDEFARQTLEGMRGPAFGPAVEPAADATPIERLAAFTGRRPLAKASR
jgi:uncharacterized protein (TIGR03086 family)